MRFKSDDILETELHLSRIRLQLKLVFTIQCRLVKQIIHSLARPGSLSADEAGFILINR